MSSLIQALDSTQIGENGHYEYTWTAQNNSNTLIEEKLVQIHFQLTRNSEDKHATLSIHLYQLLNQLKECFDSKSQIINYKKYITTFYKMIGYTRDIVHGKGEYELSYLMTRYFYVFFPELAMKLITSFVETGKRDHPYGSWKDLKYLCQHCKDSYIYDNEIINKITYNEIIEKSCNIYNTQLRKDYENQYDLNYNQSLVAKWIPRENKKFGWLFSKLAESYFQVYIDSAVTNDQLLRAKKKCYREYRRILSSLNEKLNTLQIHQCNNTWSQIDFDNVTSISMMKQKTAFLNIKRNGKSRYPERQDRIICAEKFGKFINENNSNIKGKRVSITDFTKEAIMLLSYHSQYTNFAREHEIKLLNKQWENNKSQNKKLGKMIAMVDTSGSMEGDPLYAAIALGIRIAEMSLLGKRVMTFSSFPTWVNLDNCDDFTSCVEKIQYSDWGMNTNFFAAIELILQAIVETKLPPSEVKDLVLVILSDMQIDQADNHFNKSTMFSSFEEKFKKVGMEHYGEPLTPPHILFWNLRSTNGFPNLATEKNTSMMSGINPVLINSFSEEGMESLSQYTPWNFLQKSLSDERYSLLQKYADDFFN